MSDSLRRLSCQARVTALAALLLTGSVLFAWLLPTQADAGTFTVRQCGSLLANGFAGSFGKLGRAEPLVVVQGCREGGPGRAGLYQDRSGRAVPVGEGGQFLFSTPTEVGLGSVTVSAALKDASGFRSTILALADGQTPVRLEEGSPKDGDVHRYRWAAQSGLRQNLAARLVCVREAGCENSANSSKAFLELHGIELEARDRTAPTLAVPPESGEWASGQTAIDFSAADRGSGLAFVRAEVNGFSVPLAGQERCGGLKNSAPITLRPCAPALTGVELPGRFTDRAPFREGRNSYRVCVADFAQPASGANESCSPPRFLNVDNLPPARPEDVRSPAGSSWSPFPEFDFAWRPPEEGGSPVDWLRYEVFEETVSGVGDGDRVESGEWSAGSPSSPGSGRLRVPRPGAYRAELRFRDRAGNIGSPASAVLRFDDQPPSGVEPAAPPVWLSADHFPYRESLSQAQPGGPSGIAGYALELSGPEGPDHPCTGPICQPTELDLDGGLDDRVAFFDTLPEGRSWFSAVAVSGAGVPSREPGSVSLDVDLTPPSSSLDGPPDGWSREPVELRVTATDTLSGMEEEPGQATPPMTSIVAGDGERVDSPGAQAEMTIGEEGETEVEFFARDLAGNVNDGLPGSSGSRHPSPGVATVRIDRTAPRVWLDAVGSPGDPELIRLGVEDSLSGVSGGVISLAPPGGGPITELPTEMRDGHLEARIPSDELPQGRYLISAEVEDRAGNRTSPASGEGDLAWAVQLPIKERALVSLRITGRPAGQASLRVRSGKTVPLSGRLVDGPGSGPTAVTIHEEFGPGAMVENRTREVALSPNGGFRVVLPPGPNRTVRAVWAGSLVRGRAESRSVRLLVKDSVSFSLRPGVVLNGSQVFMRGRVSGGALGPSPEGKQVAIEFLDPSRRTWRPVALTSANASGRFGFTYRFSTITTAQRIIFRARSVPEAGWPFLASASRARQVVVRPR